MKFFVDTADLDEIRDLAATGLLDGVTTNPSLIAKSGRDFFEVLRDICAVVDGPVSAEVTATEHDPMMQEGRKLAKIADNIAVVPTFLPNDVSGASGPLTCGPNDGRGRLYFLNIDDATPVANFDNIGSDDELTRADRTRHLTRGGITPSPNLIIADDGTGGITPVLCTGPECETPPFADAPIKTHWFEY